MQFRVRIASEPRTLTLEVKPEGRRKTVPSGFDNPCRAAWFFFSDASVHQQRHLADPGTGAGHLTPVSHRRNVADGVVLGKLGARMLLAACRLRSPSSAAHSLSSKLGAESAIHVRVVLAVRLVAASAGLLLGNFAHTRAQAVAFGAIE